MKEERGFSCPLCGVELSSRDSLYEHALRHARRLVAAGLVEEVRARGGLVYYVYRGRGYLSVVDLVYALAEGGQEG